MKYLKYENSVYKQSDSEKNVFISISNSKMSIVLSKVENTEVPFYESKFINLSKKSSRKIEEGSYFYEHDIVDDARDLISKEDDEDFIISVRCGKGWITRDIYTIDAIDDDSDYYQPSYFAINVAETLVDKKFEEVDILEFESYKLYHKEPDGNYYLVSEHDKEIN